MKFITMNQVLNAPCDFEPLTSVFIQQLWNSQNVNALFP